MTPAEKKITAGLPISLEIRKEYPPNIDAIDRRFNVKDKPVIYAYAPFIYNPKGVILTPELLRHEVTHLYQQTPVWSSGESEVNTNAVALWWEQYIDDPQFRLWQEIPAHQNEYLAHLDLKPNRHVRRALIKQIAKRLSGPLYGNLISLADAKKLINMERIKDHH
jgi:hypothetical protein